MPRPPEPVAGFAGACAGALFEWLSDAIDNARLNHPTAGSSATS